MAIKKSTSPSFFLNPYETLETFFVFKVSVTIFAANYERNNLRKIVRIVPETRFQERHHG